MQEQLDSQIPSTQDRRNMRGYPLTADTQHLDFTVHLARTESRILQAIKIRQDGFRNHQAWLPIDTSDRRDRQKGSVVFVAIKKGTLEPLGSLRIETNRLRSLALEGEVKLPAKHGGLHLAHVSRLSTVRGSEGRQCRNALFKALYLYSIATEIRYFFVLAVPPAEKLYFRIGFKPVFRSGDHKLPQHKYQGKDVHLLSVKVDQLPRRMKILSPELHEFVCLKRHPDIRIFESVSNAWETARTAELS